MIRSRCYTYFRIAGDLDPDAVTDMLGIEPGKTHRIGDLRANGTEYDFALWCGCRCDDYDIVTDVQMRKTIAPLLPKKDILWEIKRRFDVCFYLEVVPTVSAGDEQTPCLAPSLDVMRFCCDTGTEMSIDLYTEE